MAKDVQTQKRKASMPESGAENSTKLKNVPIEVPNLPAKKRKSTEDAAPVKSKKPKHPSDPKPTRVISKSEPKVNGRDIANISKQGAVVIKPALKNKGKKLNGSSLATPAEKDNAIPKSARVVEKKQENASAKAISKENDEVNQVLGDDDGDEGESEYDSEADDQTQALLQGFESGSDEEDALNEEGLNPGQLVPKRHALSRTKEKKLKKAAQVGSPGKPGVVYIGRIPHGFFEHEMKEYFSQFGNILKLRLSRNKQTGASKHYGWIQFESAEVADIVAKTMDNYLMFGHLLKVRVVAEENVSAELFKGANKRFKAVPWNKIEGRKLKQGKSQEAWDKKQELEEQRREKKAAKLKEIGYEFESPKLKSAASVLKNNKALI